MVFRYGAGVLFSNSDVFGSTFELVVCSGAVNRSLLEAKDGGHSCVLCIPLASGNRTSTIIASKAV